MATITASSLSLENTLEELIKEFNNLSSDVESVTLETLITAASSQITFEGATEDDNETTLTATDPTADRTITLPDVTGTVVTTGNADAGATTTTFADLDHFLINDGGTLKKMAIATALSSLPALTPSSANANALGSAALEWSDLFLGDGSVINFGNNQDVTLTHVADTGLTLNLMMVATTFEPSADTAAGDNAAFGYTSVLGAIITGEGSTNDVTLVNDSDATVLGIPTGTVNVTMAGTLDVVGDVIGANFQPDGDTATGDNAAIGYTSVLGLILTGEGSTNDVTIVNDADTTVMGVATGTTTVNFAGQVTGTGFTGTLDGVLGSGTAAAATTTTLASTTITASGIIKTDDTTAATSTTDGSLQTDGGLSVVLDAVIGDDIILISDAAAMHFGVNSEVTLTHVHDVGLNLKHTATADDKPIILTLQTGETDMAANDVIGKIAFQAPDEGTGTDAILVAAAIQARAEGDFSSSSNATSLDFMTGASEAAATKMTLTSAGDVGVGTAAPGFKVEVVGGTNDGIHIKDAASATVFGGLFTQSAALALVTRSNHDLSFGSNDTIRMTVDAGGNVGIGTTAPGTKLAVVSGTNAGISVNDGTVNTILYNTSSANGSLGTTTNHPMAFYANNAERMRIEANGNVNIGGSTAAGNTLRYLDVYNTTNGTSAGAIIRLITDNAAGGTATTVDMVKYKTGGFIINNNETNAAAFTSFNVGGERMRINSSGQLLIGKTTPSAAGSKLELHTAGDVANVFYMLKAGQVEVCMGFKTSSDSNFYVGTGSTTVGNSGQGVYLSNGGTSWSSNSDFRKKKNLVPIENALDKIANCRAMTGHFNNEADDVKKRPFLIAQDWVTALPEAVDEGTVDDDGVENLGLSYEGTIPLLVAAIKELREQNIALTSRITALEG